MDSTHTQKEQEYYNSQFKSDGVAATPGPQGWKTAIPTKEFLDFLELLKQKKVTGTLLDVGCGAGRHSIAAAKAGFTVCGVDFSDQAIAYAQRAAKIEQVTANTRFSMGNVLALQYKDAEFDVVNDDGCLHHIHPGDWGTYRQNVTRVLKPGGLYRVKAFSIRAPYFEKFRDPSHESPWTRLQGKDKTYFFKEHELVELMGEAFTLVEEQEIVHSQDPDKKFWITILKKK